MRCVFDTNAIISAMLSGNATPGVALARAYDTGEILVSVPLMRELHDVVSRPKFDRYVAPSERERFLDFCSGTPAWWRSPNRFGPVAIPRTTRYSSWPSAVVLTGSSQGMPTFSPWTLSAASES